MADIREGLAFLFREPTVRLFTASALGSFLGALLLPRISARADARVVTVSGMFAGPVLLAALAVGRAGG